MSKYIFCCFGLLLLALGCSSPKVESLAGSYLTEKIANTDLARSSEVRVFVGDSLWEYIDGGAELYHQYGFVEVATAQYKAGDIELVADIYRFDTSLNAFGLYSGMRPPAPEIVELGVEGYCAPATVSFVKGEYLVRITGYDDTEAVNEHIISMAHEFDRTVPGTTALPDGFRKLYFADKIKHTERYVSESFMGKIFLTGVYTCDYLRENDTLTGFISEDPDKQKYIQWHDEIKTDTNAFAIPRELLPIDADCFVKKDEYYGFFMVASKEGYLLGMSAGKKEDGLFIAEWLMSFHNDKQ